MAQFAHRRRNAAGSGCHIRPCRRQSRPDQAGRHIKIGTEGTYAPFTYHDDSGALVGFDVEIGQEIAEQLGVKAEFVEGTWDGLIAGLDANRYDAVINQVGINDERKAKYDFSEPYIASKAALIVRGDNTDIKSFADLKGKKSAQSLTRISASSPRQRRRARRHRRLRPVDRSSSSRAAPTPPSTTACPSSTSRSSSPTPM